MTAEMAGPLAGATPPASRRRSRTVCPVVGALPDGTPFYAPIGEVIVDGDLVLCHLCGRSLRSVATHLATHGWTKERYCESFGLERHQSLEGLRTRKLRAASLSARLVFEPAMREGSAAGRRRAAAGELTRDAAAAARGRPFPVQRTKKAARAFATVPSAALAQASRERAAEHLAGVAAAAATRAGYPDIAALVNARTGEGASLAEISREAGLHKDWLSRHLGSLDPEAAAAARLRGASRPDLQWLPVLHRLGFADVRAYLTERHVARHWTVSAIAAEVGLSYHAVESALRRHGLAREAHAAKRHAARERAESVAAGLGFDTVAAYVAQRRSAGWTWQAMTAESGQPQTWLRRHGATTASPGQL